MIEKIKRLLAERRMSRTDLELRAHLPKNRISKWYAGQGEPSASQAMRIARVLGMTLDSLLDDEASDPALVPPGDDASPVHQVEAGEASSEPRFQPDDSDPDDSDRSNPPTQSPSRENQQQEESTKVFGQKLDRLIKLANSTQSELWYRTGISQSAISEMIRGNRRVYMDQSFLLARALGVPLDYLADPMMTEPSPCPLNRAEFRVWEIVREIGPDEAWRRLVGSTKRPQLEPEASPDEAAG